MLTATKLREVLSYDPMTGVFNWLVKNNRRAVGDVAGTTNHDGYHHITIDRRIYAAHRLAWFYTHGVWPTNLIDHDDGNKNNNQLSNLREATGTQNKFNMGMYVNNQTGFKGVSMSKNKNKFVANIRLNGKATYLGVYATAELASKAYHEAAKQHHGVFYKSTP